MEGKWRQSNYYQDEIDKVVFKRWKISTSPQSRGLNALVLLLIFLCVFIPLYAYGFCCDFFFFFTACVPDVCHHPDFATFLEYFKTDLNFQTLLWHIFFYFYFKRCVWFRKYKKVALLFFASGLNWEWAAKWVTSRLEEEMFIKRLGAVWAMRE